MRNAVVKISWWNTAADRLESRLPWRVLPVHRKGHVESKVEEDGVVCGSNTGWVLLALSAQQNMQRAPDWLESLGVVKGENVVLWLVLGPSQPGKYGKLSKMLICACLPNTFPWLHPACLQRNQNLASHQQYFIPGDLLLPRVLLLANRE
jgi:hypothetical protein